MAGSSWYESSEFNTAVKQFHDRYARQPKTDMVEAKRLLELYKGELQRLLTERGFCTRLECIGSVYEGVKVGRSDTDSDLEFDVMVILPRESQHDLEVENIPDNPGYVKLQLGKNKTKLEVNKPIRMALSQRKLLSADKIAGTFMGELQQCLLECQHVLRRHVPADEEGKWKFEQLRCISDRIKLRRHGPAIQMDVMHWPATPQKLFFSVDMVPAIQIPRTSDEEDRYFVPKPVKKGSDQIEWRWSFSLKEKERLATLDRDNGCRKQVLRVLKVIRNRDTSLALLSSFHLKTVLFRKIDELSDRALWKSDHIGQRLMDVLEQLEKELDEGVMPHYFLLGRPMNLLKGMKSEAITNMRCRLTHLKESEGEMMSLLQS